MEETDSSLPITVGHKPVESGKTTDDETSPETVTVSTETPVEEDGEETVRNTEEQPSTEEAVAEEKEVDKEGDHAEKAEGVALALPDEAKDSASEIDGQLM